MTNEEKINYLLKYFPNLAEPYNGKVVPRNFGHIGHLKGSKMIDNEDVLYDINHQSIFTTKKQFPLDDVIVTEKLDGMNAGVYKDEDGIYPLNRKGYDVRSSLLMKGDPDTVNWLFFFWAYYVNMNAGLFGFMLTNRERLVFENCMMTHTLKYKFKDSINYPVFLLALFDKNNKRVDIDNSNRCTLPDIVRPPVLNRGCAIDPNVVIDQYPKGLTGCRENMEGIVYAYFHEGKFSTSAKYVSNKKLGTGITFPNSFNGFKKAGVLEDLRDKIRLETGLK